MQNPFRYFNSSPAIIRLAVMRYVRFPLSLRQAEDLLSERGIDICHETVRFWRNRFGPLFAAEIRERRIYLHSHSNWRWHLDEVFVQINGERSFQSLHVCKQHLDLLVQHNQGNSGSEKPLSCDAHKCDASAQARATAQWKIQKIDASL